MMTFTFRIHPCVRAELDAAARAEAQGQFLTAFQHLERAHVIGQPATTEHVRVHWRMFRFAVRHRMPGEAFGQAWRIVGAALFTVLGLVPEGNTGGSDVSGFRRMPIPKDLQATLDAARAGKPKRDASLRRVSATFALAAVAALGALGVGACSTAPKNLDLALEKPSAAGVYQVTLVPPVQAPAINQMHSWKVKLSTADGTPVQGASFTVDGGMPQHGHGFPTRPRVTRELVGGIYQLDGMKFSMTGWWQVRLAIEGGEGADEVTFNTVVNNPSMRP